MSGETNVAAGRPCWCRNEALEDFSTEYAECRRCGTLVLRRMPAGDVTAVGPDEAGLYGKGYWFDHQREASGYPDLTRRARADLPERCVHWLRTVLKYKLPPATTLELGAAHGGFVALLRRAGFDATGLELSPWVAEYARQTFGAAMLQGPIEWQGLTPGSFDLIAMMDVIEHLPDPAGTLGVCASLLKPDGVLVVQTPEFVEARTLEQMREAKDPFLEQLRPKEHLHLFSRRSAGELMRRIGLGHVTFEEAIFARYDQFFVASRQAPVTFDADAARAALEATPDGRFVGALLDLADNRDYYARECAARLRVIEVLDREVRRLRGRQ